MDAAYCLVQLLMNGRAGDKVCSCCVHHVIYSSRCIFRFLLLACIIYDYDKGKTGSLESLGCRSVTISIRRLAAMIAPRLVHLRNLDQSI